VALLASDRIPVPRGFSSPADHPDAGRIHHRPERAAGPDLGPKRPIPDDRCMSSCPTIGRALAAIVSLKGMDFRQH
ncbi:MAG: hypothetical protein ACQESR_26765, partial [Planctomycetota bacterium]